MEYVLHLLTSLALLLSVIVYAYRRSITKTQENGLKPLAPEPSGALPVIGHLHRLSGHIPLPRILGTMADEHGPVYSLRLGTHRALVVSSWQMMKECFTKNERNFATRPRMAASKYMNYDYAGFGPAPYGPYWREIRKMVSSELFSSQRVEKFDKVRNIEVQTSIKELFLLSQRNSNLTNMDKWFEQITMNIIVRVLIGRRFSSWSFGNNGEELLVTEAIKKVLYLTGVFVVSDYFPMLEWMDIGGYVKDMKKVAKEVDDVIEKWVKECIEERKDCEESDKESKFIDVMLSSVPKDADQLFGHGRETIVKATTMVLMWAGSESTALTMIWTLSLLLNYPHILKAAQKELDINVGRDKWVEQSDIKNLVYLQAIVKESLRMYPPAPLSGPREAIQDCTIGGYHVSKGTRLIVNVWKLHRDPEIWLDPDEFRPERFLNEHSEINYHGQNFEYLPFGTGRRMCPANMFALQGVHLTLARLLQGFYVSTPMGKHVDMGEGLGITMPKLKPLEVTITPRLSPELYI